MAGEAKLRPPVKSIDNLEESYLLSRLQEGMLFHHLCSRDIEQFICTLPESLDFPSFRRAWERVVGCHAILRTAFRWEGLTEPRHEVHRQVRLHLELKDWRGLSERDQRQRLDDYLQAERGRGFQLTVPPLMRLALVRVREAKSILAWTFHHLLLDGRSVVLVLNEVFELYQASLEDRNSELEPAQPYRLDSFQTLLDGMAADPWGRVADRPLLTEGGRRQLAVEWHDTAVGHPRETLVHERFETQVARAPNAIALATKKEALSYRELNIQANRVAHHLRSLDRVKQPLAGSAKHD